MHNNRIAYRAYGITLLVSLCVAASPGRAQAVGGIPSRSKQRVLVRDLALDKTGNLRGIVLDGNGAPIGNHLVYLRSEGRLVASATSDEQGRFRFSVARGGLYELATGKLRQLFRVWPLGAAPPSSEQLAKLVIAREVVRGQQPTARSLGPNPPTWGPPASVTAQTGSTAVPAPASTPPQEGQGLGGDYGYYAPTIAPIVLDFVNLGLGITGTTVAIIALSDDAS